MELVGKKRFKGKKGEVYNQLFCIRPVNDYDLRYSLEVSGSALETLWVSDEVFNKVTDKDFHKNITLVTDYINGRSTIVDIKIG